MVYISGGQIQQNRDWKRPSIILDLFWAIWNAISLFFQTIFKSPEDLDKERRTQGRRPFFSSGGSGGGGSGGPGPGPGGPRGRRSGMDDVRRQGRLGSLPMAGGG